MGIRVLLCDDQRTEIGDWTSDVELAVGDGSVTALDLDTFRDAVAELEQRRASAVAGTAPSSDWPDHAFDVDVLVVDYDLTLLDKGKYITGEAIAYLARCFSRCGLIVGLNQFKAGFDLSLAGHPDSYADVNIRNEQLGNPGLWTAARAGFRPWVWPQLVNEYGAFAERCRGLERTLDIGILTHLGLEHIESIIPRGLLEFLEGDRSPIEMTFRNFVLESDHGARVTASLPDPVAARIAASRVAAWLNQVLIQSQEVIADAPHLVMRIPALMADAEPREWDELARLYDRLAVDRLGQLADAIYPASDWAGRPCWYWPRASELAASLPTVSNEFDFVFCEDLSRFVPRSAARAFVAELPTAYRRRFVLRPDSSEARQLAEDEHWKYLPGDVDYRPSIRFAM